MLSSARTAGSRIRRISPCSRPRRAARPRGVAREAAPRMSREGKFLPLAGVSPQVGQRPILLVLLAVELERLVEEVQHLLDLQAESGALELQLVDRLLD